MSRRRHATRSPALLTTAAPSLLEPPPRVSVGALPLPSRDVPPGSRGGKRSPPVDRPLLRPPTARGVDGRASSGLRGVEPFLLDLQSRAGAVLPDRRWQDALG